MNQWSPNPQNHSPAAPPARLQAASLARLAFCRLLPLRRLLRVASLSFKPRRSPSLACPVKQARQGERCVLCGLLSLITHASLARGRAMCPVSSHLDRAGELEAGLACLSPLSPRSPLLLPLLPLPASLLSFPLPLSPSPSSSLSLSLSSFSLSPSPLPLPPLSSDRSCPASPALPCLKPCSRINNAPRCAWMQ